MADRTLRMPDDAEIAAISTRHFADTPLRPADLLFVFGTRVEEELRAAPAPRLWEQGDLRHAQGSGGGTPGAAAS
ncbi:MAG: YdcF family protein, partial [Bradyrhizobium sp.]